MNHVSKRLAWYHLGARVLDLDRHADSGLPPDLILALNPNKFPTHDLLRTAAAGLNLSSPHSSVGVIGGSTSVCERTEDQLLIEETAVSVVMTSLAR